jgi:ethanolamine utilization protein EutL
MEAALSTLAHLGFRESGGVPYLAHTVSRCGSFLAKEAGVPEGTALAYLIAPPLESMFALDAALKAADVVLCKLYDPPSETNFGGGLLTGTRSACAAAAAAFGAAVAQVAAEPIEGKRGSNYGTG